MSLSMISAGQSINSPGFFDSELTVSTAKMKVYNEQSKKYGAEFYKTSTITLTGLQEHMIDLTIDIPDYRYLKLTWVDGDVKYEKNESGRSIGYEFKSDDEKKMVWLYMHFDAVENKLDYITITGTEDLYGKVMKIFGYILYDVKD